MIKRLSLFMLFFTAFAVMIAHSIFPHHHHEVNAAASNHHENDHDDDGDLGHLFSNFQHVGVNSQFISTAQPVLIKQVSNPHSCILPAATITFSFLGIVTSLPKMFSDPPDISSSSGCTAFSLRGPPSLTV